MFQLAIELNEMEEGVPPTDSRRRPDQRLMEEAAWDEANREKLRLEEKQRSVRHHRELLADEALREGGLGVCCSVFYDFCISKHFCSQLSLYL